MHYVSNNSNNFYIKLNFIVNQSGVNSRPTLHYCQHFRLSCRQYFVNSCEQRHYWRVTGDEECTLTVIKTCIHALLAK